MAYSLKFISLLFRGRAVFEQLLEQEDCSVKWEVSPMKHAWPNTVCLAVSCGEGMEYTGLVKRTNKYQGKK